MKAWICLEFQVEVELLEDRYIIEYPQTREKEFQDVMREMIQRQIEDQLPQLNAQQREYDERAAADAMELNERYVPIGYAATAIHRN